MSDSFPTETSDSTGSPTPELAEALSADQIQAAATNQRNSGLDLNALIAVSNEAPKQGLLLVNRKNTWSTHPQNHDELVKCVEQDSIIEDGWSGASVDIDLNQRENIHGNDDNYTSYYEAFFYADVAGTWSFATNSDDASEIEVDEQVVASWYGGHGVSNFWGQSGTKGLAVGWHHLIYRHEEGPGDQTCWAFFKKPGDADWRLVSTSELTLKPVNLDEGLLLVTGKNTWSTHPQSHDDLVKCVEQDSTHESGWYGASIVTEVYQDENIHGNDDSYTSYYEGFFYADTAGTWQFATDSDDASEIEVDGQVAASWYGGHGVSAGWSHSGSMALGVG